MIGINRGMRVIVTTRPDAQQPLYRAPPEREEYPVDALMDLQAPVKALQYKEGAPMAMVAGAMLSSHGFSHPTTLRCGAASDGRKPTSLFFATVGESGERKSQMDMLANRPVFRAAEAMATKLSRQITTSP